MISKTKGIKTDRSLYITLIFTFVILSVVALLFSGLLQSISNFQMQSAFVSDSQHLIAKQAAENVSNYIKEKFTILKTALWLDNPITQSKEDQKLLLESLLGSQPAFRQLALFDAQNHVLAQASRLPKEPPDRFIQMLSANVIPELQKGDDFISQVYIDSNTGEPLVVMAVPVFDVYKDYQGLILAETNLKFMWDVVENIKIGDRGYAYVVDRSGNLLAYTDTSLVLKGKNTSQIKLVNAFINQSPITNSQEASIYRGITDELVVGDFVPLIMPDWAVVTELPWDEAYQPLIKNGILALLIIVVVVLISAMVGTRMARQLATPLVNLMETATQISGGNRSLQAEVSGPTEVAGLAVAFNDMTSQLQHTLENLEIKVAERTQQLEETLHFQEKILSASATGIIAYDHSGQCVLVNEALVKLVGGTKDQLLATNYHNLESWKKYGLYEAAVEAYKQNKQIERDLYMVTSFGKEAWFNCSFTTFESAGQTHLLLTINDMTEHKRIEQEILNLNRQLQDHADNLSAANKELEAFSYSVSHDLRAPLRAIHGFTNILVEDHFASLNEEAKNICQVIQDNTLRMSQLIDDLLAFSRLSRAEMQASPIDMTSMVNSVYQELTTPAEQQRILFETDVLPQVWGDLTLIHQVWSNLITNAIKFTAKREQAHIKVGSQNSNDEIVYFIHDNGAGFDMRYVEKIFGVFQRLHSEKEFEGTGVGLAIVQRILLRHGGRIWAEGEVDKGATFYFTLPGKENAQ